MNTGIQDAWNLGWKLALVVRGDAREPLLDTYEAERWPVGRTLLRYTDRLFSQFTRAMSPGPLAGWLRRSVIARVLPRILRSRRIRAFAFRFVSELGIRYRESPAVTEGRPGLRSGPHAGDRLPDARVLRNGREVFIHDEVLGARYCLLLCGPRSSWSNSPAEEIWKRYRDVLKVEYLTWDDAVDALVDTTDELLTRLAVDRANDATAQYLVRPDGYIAFRCAGNHFENFSEYLAVWLGTADSPH